MGSGEQYLPRVESTFAVVLRGYDRSQVAEHLRLVNAELRMIAADRDAAVDQSSQLAYRLDAARTDSERLREQLTRMSAPPETVDGMGERLQWMLRLAQEEVHEMRARAEAEAEAVRAEAEAGAAELDERTRRERTELEAERTAARAEIERELADARTEAERLRAEAEEERVVLDQQAETRRGEAEQDFTIALASRRAAAEADFVDLEARRRAEATRITDEANADAERLVAEAEQRARRVLTEARRRIAELRGVRDRTTAQLGNARAGLDHALAELGPLPDEDSLDPTDDRDLRPSQPAPETAEPAGEARTPMNA